MKPLSKSASEIVAVAGGTAVFLVGAKRARHLTVDRREEQTFRLCNEADDSIHAPVWVIMQLGSLGGVIASTLVAYLMRRRVTAAGVGGGGFLVWLFCKLVKRSVGRGRPEHHLADVTVRGQAQTGLGYPSGHTAVATTIALVAGRRAGPPTKAALLAGAATVSWSRMYVGAHLPLDILGGAAVGLATGAATNHVLDRYEADHS